MSGLTYIYKYKILRSQNTLIIIIGFFPRHFDLKKNFFKYTHHTDIETKLLNLINMKTMYEIRPIKKLLNLVVMMKTVT